MLRSGLCLDSRTCKRVPKEGFQLLTNLGEHLKKGQCEAWVKIVCGVALGVSSNL